jgi:hypothetical protein
MRNLFILSQNAFVCHVILRKKLLNISVSCIVKLTSVMVPRGKGKLSLGFN